MKYEELQKQKDEAYSKLQMYLKFYLKLTPFVIEELNKITWDLKPRNVFSETRYEWIIKYIQIKKLFYKYHKIFFELLDDMVRRLKISKRNGRDAISIYVANHQKKSGNDRFLLNPVRMSLITTISLYIQNLPRFTKHDPDYIVSLIYQDNDKRQIVQKFDRLFGLQPWKYHYFPQSVILTYTGAKLPEDEWYLPDQLLNPSKVIIFDHKSQQLGRIPVRSAELSIYAKHIEGIDKSVYDIPQINLLSEKLGISEINNYKSDITISNILNL